MIRLLELLCIFALSWNVSTNAAIINCAKGYKCFEDSMDRTWVISTTHEHSQLTCTDQCGEALCATSVLHTCAVTAQVEHKLQFAPIATGLGFSCTHGTCWQSKSNQ